MSFPILLLFHPTLPYVFPSFQTSLNFSFCFCLHTTQPHPTHYPTPSRVSQGGGGGEGGRVEDAREGGRVGWDGAGVRGEGMDWFGGESGRCGKERDSRMEKGGG
jgi:hypothetical protein